VLIAEKQRVARYGLNLSVVEGGPPTTRIILHKDGRDEQIEYWKRCIDAMGKAGIDAVCYDWMPPAQGVLRTSFDVPSRGGALVSGFRLADYDNAARTDEGETTDEQMWDDLEYFLRRVIPAAEGAQVRLAMHPDDPPLSPLQGLARIIGSPAAFDRLFEIAPSEANAMTFCQGCFAEMGVDVPATIRHFKNRIAFAHFRDVRGSADDFVETFHGDGRTDMLAAMRAYREIGFEGVIRPDHVPLLDGVDRGEADEGYTMLGRLHAVGYMQGLMAQTAT
jgi:mannonate dehydratase